MVENTILEKWQTWYHGCDKNCRGCEMMENRILEEWRTWCHGCDKNCRRWEMAENRILEEWQIMCDKRWEVEDWRCKGQKKNGKYGSIKREVEDVRK